MDFYDIIPEVVEGMSINPYAGNHKGKWIEGKISIDYLNEYFGQYTSVEEMKNATESEGLKLYFDWLKDKGILN